MKKLITISLFALILSFVLSCDGNQSMKTTVDSLNQRAYDTRYKNLDSTTLCAQTAYQLATDYTEGRALALNNLAFVEYMKMDFDSARSLYEQSTQIARSELTRLLNDVGMMNVCKITAQNKDFYTYLTNAQRRIGRLEESEVVLTPLQLSQFNYARSEFHFNASSYYNNMWQEAEADSELNIVRSHPEWLVNDPAQQVRFNLLTNNVRRAFAIADEFALTFMQAHSLLSFNDSMALFIAQPALNMFREYGSVYSTAQAYIKISECLLRQGNPEAALDTATKALEYVNIQHQRVSGKNSEFLYPYRSVMDTLSTEMKWMKSGESNCAWEWIASIREHLSKVYASLGMKPQSDYNRNIYLDILEATRQDKLLEVRMEELHKTGRNLNMYIVADIMLALIILTLAYFFMRHRRRKAASQYDKEQQNADVQFQEWMDSLQNLYESIDEQENIIDSQTYLSSQHIAEQKRSYIDKCTSLSMVRSITPFLDRALNEVEHLHAGNETDDRRKERMEYLSELIDKINQYNETLSHWIKIRQGAVALNIETFPIQPLLDTLQKNRNTFASKGLTLNIPPTQLAVKADRALTLFMMNTLMDNARKYTSNGGSVSLSVKELDDCVEIAVTDTGGGMSQQDIRTILTEKVYDSSTIGREGTSDEYKSQKGFGFGLMNCKGIIDKYKKSNPLFSVCKFDIQSEIGKGSRFSFCLPKGVIKCIAVLLLMLPFATVAMARNNNINGKDSGNASLLHASSYADSVYYANIQGHYDVALCYADTALHFLNEYYTECNPDGHILLSLIATDGMPDIEWLNSGFATDYFVLMDIRNEVSVAALALNEWDIYEYNNKVYTQLYKLMSQDNSLESYCEDVRNSNTNRQSIVVVLIIIVIIGIITFVLTYYHRHMLRTFNLRQLLQLGSNLFGSKDDEWIEGLQRDINDIKASYGLVIGIRRNEKGTMEIMKSQDCPDRQFLSDLLSRSCDTNEQIQLDDGHIRIFPLQVEEDDNTVTVGAMAIFLHSSSLSNDEKHVFVRISQFVATYLYYADMKIEARRNQLMLKEDENLRSQREEAEVHVQNLVLDTCLSSIKHETMYYPSRIKVLLEQTDNSDSSIADIRELLQYYNEVFTLLSNQASSQLNKFLFKRKRIEASSLGQWATKSMKRMNRKLDVPANLDIDVSDHVIFTGDEDMLHYLIDNLLLAVTNAGATDLRLTFGHNEDAHPIITFKASAMPPLDTDQLFYADNLQYDEREDRLSGTEWMVCRQIVREHDEYTGQRGCRINASQEGGELTVLIELN